MPYIGNTIRAADDYRLIDDISSSFNGSTTSFALQVAGSAPVPFPKSPQQVLISVNGVIQEPDPTGASGFNLVGTNIVFSSAPTNGHAFFGIIYATADYLNAGGNFPSGSLGAPSLTFIGDEDTGIYRKGSGSIGFVSNSTEIANTDSNGITISSGNLIIPDSIIHNGDSDTKIRFGSANEFSVETAGVERFEITPTEVTFNDTGADTDFRIEGDSDANLFKVDASSDRIGIGIAAPTRKLQIKSAGNNATQIGLIDVDSTNEVFRVGQQSDGDGFVQILDDSGQVQIGLEATGDSFFTGGSLGLGTSSPDTLLHLAGGSPNIKLNNTGTSASANDILGAIIFQHADADDPGITAKIQCVAEDNAGNSFLAFYNGDGGNADERLRITSAGKFGINIDDNTGPDLQICTAGGQNGEIRVGGTNTTAVGFNISYNNGGATKTSLKQMYRNTNAAAEMEFDSGFFTFLNGTAGSEIMRIQSGVVSIGTNSPSGSASRLQVEHSGENNVYFVGNTSTSGARLILQNKNTTANSFTGVLGADGGGQTTAAIKFYSADNDTNEGYLTLETRPASGTPTERVRISSDGYLTQSALPVFAFKGLGNAQSSSRMTSDGDMLFTSATINSSHYNNSNGRFTAPVAGKYYFQVNALLDNNAAAGTRVVRLKVNGSIITTIVYHYFDQNAAQYYHVSGGGVLSLSKDDYVTFFGSEGWHVGVETNVSGFLIG